MKSIRRLTARTVLVPLALLVLAFGSSLPANAAPLPDASLIQVLPDSLNW